jgi:hypothetical protein
VEDVTDLLGIFFLMLWNEHLFELANGKSID